MYKMDPHMESESWSFTVIRSKGLHLLRPERSWRPIVCITVEDKAAARPKAEQAKWEQAEWKPDYETTYETVLGLDGQNPNQKEVFVLGPNVSNTTKFSIQVYYQPPGKKKVKRTKRIPVACCSCVLGDVVAKQDTHKEKTEHAQLRLQAQCSSKRGKKKNDADCEPAILYVRVKPPQTSRVPHREDILSEDEYATSHHPETTTENDPFSEPPSPIEPIIITDITNTTGIDIRPDAGDQTARKRVKKRKKRTRGYLIHSDDELDGMVTSEYESDEVEVAPADEGYDSTLDKEVDWDNWDYEDEGDTTLSPDTPQPSDKEQERWPWIIRVSGISAMLDPIIPMHSNTQTGSGPTITYDPAPDNTSPDVDSPQIPFTASPKPQFAQLKQFSTIDSEQTETADTLLEWMWFKFEAFLCVFTVYGELCSAARSLDSLLEYSKLHHGNGSSPSLLRGGIGGDGTPNAGKRSNSFSSFRSWGSSRPTLLDADVEGGLFRGSGSLAGRFGSSLTVAGDGDFERLEREARERVEKVYTRLQMEWTYVAGLLVALAAVDTAVFAISSDSLFAISSYARPLVATASVCSGCGIVCVVWFLWWYGWASGVGVGAQGGVGGGLGGVEGFMSRALDVNKTYVSFALASRMPACLMLLSALAMMGFLAVVAYDAAPIIVWVVCSGVVVGMCGQFVIWGIIRAVRGVIWGVRGVGRGVRCGIKGVWERVSRVGRRKGEQGGVEGGGGDQVKPQTQIQTSPLATPPAVAVADTGRERVTK
ncbi:hypothetical protein V5O48_015691, partial [Marasmius crinis-equi]